MTCRTGHFGLFVVSMCMFALLCHALSLGSNGVAAGGDPDAAFGSTVQIGLAATTIGIYRARRSQSDQESRRPGATGDRRSLVAPVRQWSPLSSGRRGNLLSR